MNGGGAYHSHPSEHRIDFAQKPTVGGGRNASTEVRPQQGGNNCRKVSMGTRSNTSEEELSPLPKTPPAADAARRGKKCSPDHNEGGTEAGNKAFISENWKKTNFNLGDEDGGKTGKCANRRKRDGFKRRVHTTQKR